METFHELSLICEKATYDGVVQLQEESQEVAEAMIVFLYQNKYDDRSCLARMHFNLEVFIAADKFNIPGLAELARKKLMYSLDEMADFRDFLATIQTLYRQVPFHAPGIREKVVALAKATSLPPGNIQPDPAKTQAIDCLVNEVPNFGKELLVALAQHFWDLRSDIEQREALMEERDAFWNQRQLELTQEAAPLEQRIEELKQREETLSQEKQVLLERQGQSNRSSRKFKCLRCQSSFAMLNSTMDSRTLVCPYCKVRALVLR